MKNLKDKSSLLFLLCLMVIMAAFGALKENKTPELHDWFLFSDQLLSTQTWFYFLLMHLVNVMLGYLIRYYIDLINHVY
jgi:hypothetical protein